MSAWSTDAQRRGHNKGLGNTLSARAIKRRPSFLEARMENPDNLDPPMAAGVTCKGCDHFVLDASLEEAHKFQGWWWCGDCFYALREVQDARDVAVRP